MELYGQWKKSRGEGANMTILQLLAHADLEYKRLVQLGQWTTKNNPSDRLGTLSKASLLLCFQSIQSSKTNSNSNNNQINQLVNQRRTN